MTVNEPVDVLVIGAGQAGLAAGYYLRRTGLNFIILDAEEMPGGAWQHGWNSLRLFTPAAYAPLPGWGMPEQDGETYPTASHVVRYLRDYEERYGLPVQRPVRVTGVHRGDSALRVETDHGQWQSRVVISATGTWTAPFIPAYPGSGTFGGEQMHTVDYRTPEHFRGKRVVVVGSGNSAAQIVAELSTVADTTWATRRPPRFMDDRVDGRVLFEVATRAGEEGAGPGLGDIVMVPPVREARDRGDLRAHPVFDRLTPDGVAWADGTRQTCDAIIWCTGFRAELAHLRPLKLSRHRGVPRTVRIGDTGGRSVDEPRLYLLGYGEWTGFASATIIGAGRAATAVVSDVRG